MSVKLISNTLAGFKAMLQSAQVNGIYIKTILFDAEGNPAQEKPFAPIGRVQSNSFSIVREGKEFWVEFGKATNWQFELDKGIAAKLYPIDGRKTIQFEFSDPAFFGIK